MNLAEQIGIEVLGRIKRASWFPYKSGRLKFEATNGFMTHPNTYCINFNSKVAPYVAFLEEGTSPHNIPRAFGRELPFGTFGRFDGKFHPGSTKHKGFIKDKSVGLIVDYIQARYNGIVEVR